MRVNIFINILAFYENIAIYYVFFIITIPKWESALLHYSCWRLLVSFTTSGKCKQFLEMTIKTRYWRGLKLFLVYRLVLPLYSQISQPAFDILQTAWHIPLRFLTLDTITGTPWKIFHPPAFPQIVNAASWKWQCLPWAWLLKVSYC